jgi:bile acid:Na+ symporter, BASS family
MTIAALSTLLVTTSLFGLVASLGMASSWRDVVWLIRSPALLVRAIVSMQLLTPLIAVGMAATLPLHPGVKIALVLLSLSPVPPALPGKELKVGGNRPFAISLLVLSALLSIAVIPASLSVLNDVTSYTLGIRPMIVARLIAESVLLPLAAGMIVGAINAELGLRISPVVAKVATGLLILGILPPLIVALPAMGMLLGDGTLVVCAALCVAALLIGHLLGGPDRGDRTVLALSTAMRHPAMAIALAKANFADEPLVVPAILLYLLVAVVIRVPYMKLSVRRQAEWVAGRRAYR